MYKDGDPVNFELFTGARTVPSVIGFIQDQMDLYKVSHRVKHKEGEARFVVKHGARHRCLEGRLRAIRRLGCVPPQRLRDR